MIFILYGIFGLITSFTYLVYANVIDEGDDIKYPLAILTVIGWPLTLVFLLGLNLVCAMSVGAERVAARFK